MLVYAIICRDFFNLFLVDRLHVLFNRRVLQRWGIDARMNVLEEWMTMLSNYYSLEQGIILDVSEDYINIDLFDSDYTLSLSLCSHRFRSRLVWGSSWSRSSYERNLYLPIFSLPTHQHWGASANPRVTHPLEV